MRPTHGAEQRRIWCSRHGRVRLSNMASEQVRSRNAFWSWLSVRFTAPALAKGPKYEPASVLRPRCLRIWGKAWVLAKAMLGNDLSSRSSTL